MNEIAKRLHDSIAAKKYSYGELAKMTGIPKSAIQRYATGETEKIPLDRLELLAQALGISSAYLMGWEEMVDDAPDQELNNMLEDLRSREDMRMLFKLAHGASPEDVRQAVKIIEALRK